VVSITPVIHTHGSSTLLCIGFLLVQTPELYRRACRKRPCADGICICMWMTFGDQSMWLCANQSCLSGHSFGGCLARITTKGGIDNSRYISLQRACLRRRPTSNAGAVFCVARRVAGVGRGAAPGAQRVTRQPRAPPRPVHALTPPLSILHRCDICTVATLQPGEWR
jgi:hypothetical protein